MSETTMLVQFGTNFICVSPFAFHLMQAIVKLVKFAIPM